MENDHHPDAFESIIFNILNEFPKYKDRVEDFNNIKDILIGFGKILSINARMKLLILII